MALYPNITREYRMKLNDIMYAPEREIPGTAQQRERQLLRMQSALTDELFCVLRYLDDQGLFQSYQMFRGWKSFPAAAKDDV